MRLRAAVLANRALAFAHRQIMRADRLLPQLALRLADDREVVRDGVLQNYGSQTFYVEGTNQERGLYPFEQRAIEAHFPPPPARILLPGAGAGREAFALRAAGFEVEAFDPAPALVRAAAARAGPGAVRLGDLETWIAATRDAPASFDAVFAGWTLWTHLLHRDEREAALRAFRRACPRGPVLLSFWRREKVFDLEESVIDPPTTGGLARLLRPRGADPAAVWRNGMFGHLVSEAELQDEARVTEYRVVHYERDGSRFPNAVLVPA